MQRLEVSGAVRTLYGSLGVRGLMTVLDGVRTASWPGRLILQNEHLARSGLAPEIVRTSRRTDNSIALYRK